MTKYEKFKQLKVGQSISANYSGLNVVGIIIFKNTKSGELQLKFDCPFMGSSMVSTFSITCVNY